MPLDDTSPKARDVYFRRLAEMKPSERIRLGADLWSAGDSVQRAAIRAQHRQADEGEIVFQLAVRRFGAELAREVTGCPPCRVPSRKAFPLQPDPETAE